MFDSISLPAVLVAWLLTFMSGFIWFGPKTFYPIWCKLMGKTPKDVPGVGTNMGITFGSVTLGQPVAVVTLALFMGVLVDAGKVTSALDGALVWIIPARSSAVAKR
jgi:hypothetical protein